MALKDYINLPGFTSFKAVCKDSMMQEHKVTEGREYTILGKLFGFFLLINDKGNLDKISQSRFEVKK